ncbi:HEXXH motif-containing putative peptide modification protein [Microcoleus sp. K1-B6]|uniref:aKG-HExxH-type peptide beta-hydroxylase n=1 Tax=unclassified Microcoleus TaxID=2642155 RepID=UPI002FD24E8D
MIVCAEQETKIGTVDLELTCKLDDTQLFYHNALIKYVEESATRHIAMLHILSDRGYELAAALLKQSDDVDILSGLFLQYRELEAKARSLFQAYVSGDTDRIQELLINFYTLFSPLSGGLTLGLDPLRNVKVTAGSILCFPTLAKAGAVTRDSNLGEITEQAIEVLIDDKCDRINWWPDSFTRSGIRISTAITQPAAAGNEFNFIEKDYVHDISAVTTRHDEIRLCLDMLPFLDIGLGVSMSRLMKVYTVLPRYSPTTRKAGSVSHLPGWAWQDFDPEADRMEERCHLCVQMVHEFFHTKVNLVEKNVRLYTTDGNSPEVFSPWKNRDRPLRQVIHALLTFSAGAAVWAKLVSSPWFSSEKLYSEAESYWVETLNFADIAYQGLIKSESLTDAGKVLVSSCVDNLRVTIKSGRSNWS